MLLGEGEQVVSWRFSTSHWPELQQTSAQKFMVISMTSILCTHTPCLLQRDLPHLVQSIRVAAWPLSTSVSATMSRSAKDATRFTPTTPHAYSRNSPGSTPGFPANGSPSAASTFQPYAPPNGGGQPVAASGSGETPSQKVARLRAEHLRRRAMQLTTWDKMVLRGRRVADRLHVWTVFGLLSLTGKPAGPFSWSRAGGLTSAQW